MLRQITRDFGQSLQFNGSSDKALGAALTNLSAGVSIAFWFYPNDMVTAQAIFANATSSNDRISISINGNGIQAGYYNGSAFISPQSIALGEHITKNMWHFLVYTFDGVTGNLYIDGTKKTGTTNPATASTSALSIGCRNDSIQFYKGFLSNVLIYRGILSTDEINAFRYRGEYPSSATLYSLNGNVIDQNSGNPLTLTGGTYSANVPIKSRTVAGARTVV